jgi:hypothetical protein
MDRTPTSGKESGKVAATGWRRAAHRTCLPGTSAGNSESEARIKLASLAEKVVPFYSERV